MEERRGLLSLRFMESIAALHDLYLDEPGLLSSAATHINKSRIIMNLTSFSFMISTTLFALFSSTTPDMLKSCHKEVSKWVCLRSNNAKCSSAVASISSSPRLTCDPTQRCLAPWGHACDPGTNRVRSPLCPARTACPETRSSPPRPKSSILLRESSELEPGRLQRCCSLGYNVFQVVLVALWPRHGARAIGLVEPGGHGSVVHSTTSFLG